MKQSLKLASSKLAVLAVLLGVTAGPAVAQEKIKIGVIVTLSGPAAGLGQQSRDGFQLAIKDLDATEIHLRNCDFCGAELQLLTRHRVDMSSDRLVEMPAQLRCLAEELFGQIGRFTLTDLTTDNRLSG